MLDPGLVGDAPRFGGLIILRSTHRHDTTTNIVRNARLTAYARPHRWLVLKLQADFAAAGRVGADSAVNGFAITDAFLQLSPRDTLPVRRVPGLYPALLLGQFKSPFSLEYMSSVARLLTASRSMAVDRLAPRRDVGALAQLDVRHRVVLLGGVMSGEPTNARANPDARHLSLGRLVVLPRRDLALAVKAGGEGGDRLTGYDARWLAGPFTIEGEAIQRSRPPGGGDTDASGGYAAIACRILPWLEPVVKWEQYDQTRPTAHLATWLTAGANVTNAAATLRAQVNVVRKRDHGAEAGSAERGTELVAQLIATF